MFVTIDKRELPEWLGKGVAEVFSNRLGLLIRDYWDEEARSRLVATTLANRDKWLQFGGKLNYSALGNALYGFRANQDIDEYHASARQSDQMMATLFPDLERSMVDPFQNLVAPAAVRKRKGFCGPGIVIQNEASEHYPHFDVNEGLGEVYHRFPMGEILFTMVGMLQKPPGGGRLFLWDQTYEPTKDYLQQVKVDASQPDFELDYPEGSLAILNGMKLHEIEASRGQRITVNCHFMRRADDTWSYWF